MCCTCHHKVRQHRRRLVKRRGIHLKISTPPASLAMCTSHTTVAQQDRGHAVQQPGPNRHDDLHGEAVQPRLTQGSLVLLLLDLVLCHLLLFEQAVVHEAADAFLVHVHPDEDELLPPIRVVRQELLLLRPFVLVTCDLLHNLQLLWRHGAPPNAFVLQGHVLARVAPVHPARWVGVQPTESLRSDNPRQRALGLTPCSGCIRIE
mmetsp:Transcript_130868/g.326520  ORF Transcript_130868/g.326520 Transcript_130868/m.326520 type:complete len:205 (-) Transcript_130868:1247-1861(-)